MPENVLIKPQRIYAGAKQVISTKHAANYLGVSYEIFKKQVDDSEANKGTIVWQARIDDGDGSRPVLGFVIAYLDEVLSVVGNKRRQGLTVFTETAKNRIAEINKAWRGKEDVDWKKDVSDTSRFMAKKRQSK